MFDRATAVHVELFREENVPLETEEAKLGQQYQKLTGSLTVRFRGQERTLTEMARYQEEPDRGLRREAWELTTERRLQESANFEEQFTQLFGLRQQIARNAGFADYVAYAFRRLCRFDYAPADCFAFHEAVEREVMPLVRELQARRREEMRLEVLRPWDVSVDPFGRPPLRPFRERRRAARAHPGDLRSVGPGTGSGFRRCRSSGCSTSRTARARRRAVTSTRWPRRGCRSSS